MLQSPSWEANWFAASQVIPRISRNPKVHYRTHKRPQPVSILGQPNPVHIPTSHFLEICPNIIHTSTPRSPHWSPSLRFPHQNTIHLPLLTRTCHKPSPSHSSIKILMALQATLTVTLTLNVATTWVHFLKYWLNFILQCPLNNAENRELAPSINSVVTKIVILICNSVSTIGLKFSWLFSEYKHVEKNIIPWSLLHRN